MKPKRELMSVATFLIILILVQGALAAETYEYVTQWDGSIILVGEPLNTPFGVAVDSLGNVYVADNGNSQIQKFDSSGTYVTQWGSAGSGDGQFNYLMGVAADSLGNVYVVDWDNDFMSAGGGRIQKFDSDGTYLTQWGSYGSGVGEFNLPIGVAVDSLGNVYVTDAGNSRIQKFDSGGNYLTQWGTDGLGDGEFNVPAGVAIDSSGYIYVADSGNYRIQKFDSGGTYVMQWGSQGSGDGQFNYLMGVAVDSLGNVYVVDTDNGFMSAGGGRIQKFDSDGTYLTQWGTEGSGDGQFNGPFGVAVDSLGNVYVTDAGNSRIQKFDSGGTYMVQWDGSESLGGGPLNTPYGVTADSNGNVYVANTYYFQIQKFDSSGTYITQWGSQGSGNGEFNGPGGVAVDSVGNIYVADFFNNRIQKFDSDGTYITQWGSQGSGNGEFFMPFGVAVDSLGNVYVADSGNNRIQKFDSVGTYLTQWGYQGSGDGEFSQPAGVAVDNFGNVYVADSGNSRIQKFDSVGTYIMQWGTEGTGDGQFNDPGGVTVDSSGNVYVVDSGNDRIQKFDSGGTCLTQWGTEGSGDGEFNMPFGIAVDSLGNVYVTDTGNSRIQKFSKVLTPGSISVTSDPAGADIYIDGIGTGLVTPFTLSDVTPGSHVVKVSLAGYMDAEQEVIVIAGSSKIAQFTLVPISQTGSIAVTSTPSGAEIWIDGKDTGKVTPYTFDKAPGDYDVYVTLNGYQTPAARSVSVIAGQTSSADFSVEPILTGTGSIKVTSARSGAAIYLDGENTGKFTPDIVTDVPIGNHEVYVILEGHNIPDAKTVEVELGDKVNVHFILKSDTPEYGSIKVTSAPAGATIFLDGVNTGKFTPDTITDVTVGNHAIYITFSGYTPPDPTTVTIVREEKANIHFVLKNKLRIMLK